MESTSGPTWVDQVLQRRVAGVAFLFSGAALLMHILGQIPLRIGLLGTFAMAGVLLSVAWRRGDGDSRRQLRLRILVGLVAGLVALAAYDLAKAILAIIDPSPFDPFGAIPIFGVLLAGPTAPDTVVIGAGIGYHVLNGVLFGVAFSVLFGLRGILAGAMWGLFLELFQSTLYPGWLDIRLYQEFLSISLLGHLAYGATLGYLCLRWLRPRIDTSRREVTR